MDLVDCYPPVTSEYIAKKKEALEKLKALFKDAEWFEVDELVFLLSAAIDRCGFDATLDDTNGFLRQIISASEPKTRKRDLKKMV